MSARAPIIVNYTITAGATWEKALSAIGAVRKWFMKPRETTDDAYDYAFKDNPTEFMTNGGSGTAFDGCEIPDIFVRGTVGSVIEILYWQ